MSARLGDVASTHSNEDIRQDIRRAILQTPQKLQIMVFQFLFKKLRVSPLQPQIKPQEEVKSRAVRLASLDHRCVS